MVNTFVSIEVCAHMVIWTVWESSNPDLMAQILQVISWHMSSPPHACTIVRSCVLRFSILWRGKKSYFAGRAQNVLLHGNGCTSYCRHVVVGDSWKLLPHRLVASFPRPASPLMEFLKPVRDAPDARNPGHAVLMVSMWFHIDHGSWDVKLEWKYYYQFMCIVIVRLMPLICCYVYVVSKLIIDRIKGKRASSILIKFSTV